MTMSSLLSPSPALTAHLTRFNTTFRRAFSRRRPWLELVDSSAFSRPSSLTEATTRIQKNLSYFRINYVSILALVLALSLLSHPLSLLTLLSLLATWLLYLLHPTNSILIFNRTFSHREAMWILVAVTVLGVFMTNIASLLMSSTAIGIGIVCAHGAFRGPDDLFLDDHQEKDLMATSSGLMMSPPIATQV